MVALFQWLSVCASVFMHPFYISMTDINYNNKSQSLEVSVRIFTDDFEKTLRKNCNCKVDLLSASDKKAMEPVINNYIQKHLQLKIDGKMCSLEFVGYSQEEESTWNYFQVKNVTQLKRIDISNTLLHDYKEEQINMLHISANGKDQTEKLDYPNRLFSGSY